MEAFSRHKGVLTPSQQQALWDAEVLICGLGGMGGVCAEVLARMGIGGFTLVDGDRYETSNFNRQIHSNIETVGRLKAEVIGEEIAKISPEARVRVFAEPVGQDNIDQLLEVAQVVVNGMDQMKPSIILERTARKKGLTLVDAWLTPFASVFVIGPDDPHWEETLHMPTAGVPIDQIDDAMCEAALRHEVKYTFSAGDPMTYVDPETVEGVLSGATPRPSMAPVVWLSGTLMANEVFKLIASYPVTSHQGIMYDQYKHVVLTPGSSSRDD